MDIVGLVRMNHVLFLGIVTFLAILFVLVPLLLKALGLKETQDSAECFVWWRRTRWALTILVLFGLLIRLIGMASVNETPRGKLDRSLVDQQVKNTGK